MVQNKEELERFYKEDDPWGYETNEHDARRKACLLSEIPRRHYRSVLDIGCGHGFITRDLPGDHICGVDISEEAIAKAAAKLPPARFSFRQGQLFELPGLFEREQFDLIVICGVLYPQYIGKAKNSVYLAIDKLLTPGGILMSVHINEWYSSRFPYLLLKQMYYDYREYVHVLEAYIK